MAMRSKILSILRWVLLDAGLVIADQYLNDINYVGVKAIVDGTIGLSIPSLCRGFQDLTDRSYWQEQCRGFERSGFLKKDTLVRISFSYLFRIKYRERYLLVKNHRIGKYQPVGGVYTMKPEEYQFLQDTFHVKPDENVPRKDTSFYEYRIKVPHRFLKDFLRRFRKKADREDVENLSREFKEEMVEPGFLSFHKIRYRYLGCMLEFHYSEHFQCYELLLADVVNLEILPEQLMELERLEKSRSMSGCRFFSEEEIERRGVVTGKENLKELITNHSWKILEKFENMLEHGDKALEKVYEVSI